MGCENIHVVGSTALDQLGTYDSDREPYILILQHPNTTDPEPIEPLIEAVRDIPIHKVWVNPNVDAGNKSMLKLIHREQVEFVKDLPPDEYYRLMCNAECCVGNSSSFIKEGAYMGVPAVLVGNRQYNREHGDNVVIAENNRDEVLRAILQQMGKCFLPDYRFGDGTASKKIVEVLKCLE
jgi:UDP-N-acetylglucosamine 2-epimerase